MYKCNECGHEFDEPERWDEMRGEFWGVMAYETMAGCPRCYSTDFDEISEDDDDETSDDEEEGDDDDC
jgi:DNA-directed RNA polymerase subunit RPC12/RpoP